MTLALRAVAALAEGDRSALEREVSGLAILADVVGWCAARKPPARIADVVIQDEYTHDVVVALAPDRFLVFDAT